MKDIDKRYREISGLTERNLYSIFYSRIDPSNGLVIGINPGGDPDNWSEDQLASKSFYENWEHEYVDCKYAIQEPMLPFLMEVFDTDEEGVRRIPKTNLTFRRSSGTDDFKKTHGMTLTQGQHEALPFLEEIIKYVSPKVIILEGMSILDSFRIRYSDKKDIHDIEEKIFSRHRGKQVRIFHAQNMYINCLGRKVPVIAIGHPSSFGNKPEFEEVKKSSRKIVNRFKL